METLERGRRLDLAAMVAALSAEVDAFAGVAEPDDDQTVLGVEIR